MNITIRKSAERGQADHGWLQAKHSFSFANYYDPKHMHFGPLRVLNEDIIQAGEGFGLHSHHNAEIISYVLSGGLKHEDSMANGGILRPGDVQYMSAGSGITHSEFNSSKAEPVHIFQIWILPNEKNTEPRYLQRHFDREDRDGKWQLLASANGRGESFSIRQDVDLYAALIEAGKSLNYQLPQGRKAWLQLASGELRLNGRLLQAGDSAAIKGSGELNIAANQDAELLFFDFVDLVRTA
ncbi:pirin family protein [Lentisphaera profundi]|uniref:Pirin family protein n=1 Tax=Lentisphaera profundi TaxID=1658616 RepID=A0ABY7W417_9BACT|nr:pirin family protein [Lentisphaera profundi]WDE98983.1 pirin family protein [Lentisphaera profundi]